MLLYILWILVLVFEECYLQITLSYCRWFLYFWLGWHHMPRQHQWLILLKLLEVSKIATSCLRNCCWHYLKHWKCVIFCRVSCGLNATSGLVVSVSALLLLCLKFNSMPGFTKTLYIGIAALSDARYEERHRNVSQIHSDMRNANHHEIWLSWPVLSLQHLLGGQGHAAEVHTTSTSH